MAQDEVSIKITADDSGISVKLDNTGNAIKRFARNSEDAAQRSERAWQHASEETGKRLESISRAITGALGEMGKGAAEVEQSLAKVNVIAKLDPEGIKEVGAQVEELSNKLNTSFDTKTLTAGLAEVYQGGLRGADSLKLLGNAAKAAQVGHVDLSTAIKIGQAGMQSYKLTADQSVRTFDVLAKTMQVGKLSFQQLADMMPAAMATGSQYGVSMEEIAAAIATLSQKGLTAEQSLAAINGLLAQIADPAAKSAKQFAAMGIAFGDTALRSKGLIGVIQDVITKTDGNTVALNRLLRGHENVVAAMKLASDGAADYKDKLAQIQDAHGSLDEALQTTMSTAQMAWESFLKEAHNAADQMGEQILPMAVKGIGLATSLLHSWTELTPQTKEFAVAGLAVAAALTGISGALLVAAPMIVALPEAFATVGVAITGTIGLMSGIAPTLAAVGVAAYELGDKWRVNWEGIGNVVKMTADGVKQEVELIVILIQKAMDELQSLLDRHNNITKTLASSSGFQAIFGTGPLQSMSLAQGAAGGVGSEGNTLTDFLASLGIVKPAGGSGPDLSKYHAASRVLDKGWYGDGVTKAPDNPMAQSAEQYKKMMEGLNSAHSKMKKTVELTDDQLKNFIRSTVKVYGDIGLDRKTLEATYRLAENAKAFGFPIQITSGRRHGSGGSFHNSGQAIDVQAQGANVSDDYWTPEKIKELSEGTGFASGINEYLSAARAITHGTGPHVHLTTGLEHGGVPGTFYQHTIPSGKITGKDDTRGLGSRFDAWQKKQDEFRQKYTEFLAAMSSDTEKQLAEIDKRAKEAIKGARTPDERQQVLDAASAQKGEIAARQMQELRDGDITEKVTQDHIALAKKEFDERRALGVADLRARIREIDELLEYEGVKNQQSHQMEDELTQERRVLSAQADREDEQRADKKIARELLYLEKRKQLNQITLADEVQEIQQELTFFQGSIDKKQELELLLHEKQMEMDKERWQTENTMLQSFEQQFSGMLTQTLSGQQNWSQTMANLWKSLANTIIAELAKCIVEALALKSIMDSIFGFFGGIFGLGGASEAISIPHIGGLDIVDAAAHHSGGLVSANGPIPVFHSGGLVVPQGVLAPDETFAKLQFGEVVLSRQQVANARAAAAQSNSKTVHNTINMGNIVAPQNADPDEFARALADQIQHRLQGAA